MQQRRRKGSPDAEAAEVEAPLSPPAGGSAPPVVPRAPASRLVTGLLVMLVLAAVTATATQVSRNSRARREDCDGARLLVTGANRSGSTWVGDVLGLAEDVDMRFEPFHVRYRSRWLGGGLAQPFK